MDWQTRRQMPPEPFSPSKRRRISPEDQGVAKQNQDAGQVPRESYDPTSMDIEADDRSDTSPTEFRPIGQPITPLTNESPGSQEPSLTIEQGKGEAHICYGAMCDVRSEWLREGDRSGPKKEFIFMQALELGTPIFLRYLGSVENLARLDRISSEGLQSLRSISTQIRIVPVVRQIDHKKVAKKGITIPLSINIYGPESISAQVGELLDGNDVVLQHPHALSEEVEYINPHFYHPTGRAVLTHLVGMKEEDLKSKQISDEIENILGSLGAPRLGYASVPPNIGQPQSVLVALTKTQMVALHFMIQRENEDHCRKVHRELRDLVSASSSRRLSLATGGILADSMGLGKTLTALSLMVLTLRRQEVFPDERMAETDGARECPATLIVVPSSQVLDVWTQEIDKRLVPGTLRTAIFHGPQRPRSALELISSDVVLTTYATLMEDNKRLKLLQKIVWFRIVLDEAHWIRNQNSKQFRAAQSLSSLRRWCLTGTPIQNRLEDMGSLVSFLHLDPFSELSVFRRVILEPILSNSSTGSRSLQLLLQAICLRRDMTVLKIPEPVELTTTIDLSASERDGYQAILQQSRNELEHIVSRDNKSIKKYNILFIAMLRLRRFCNTGNLISGQGNADDCETCRGPIQDTPAMQDGPCLECGRMFQDKALELQMGMECPSPSAIPLSASLQDVPRFYTSKLARLMDNLQCMQVGDKSVVFSYWTSTLDLAAAMLQDSTTTRIDGTIPGKERLRRLDLFRPDPAISVLLMTIGIGAVGLNLTVANFVHIVEPQWNPSVEEQAISRAVRMGQTRKVTIIRYIVSRSVEENIAHLQKKKRNLAKFTLGDLDKTTRGNFKDLESVLDLGE